MHSEYPNSTIIIEHHVSGSDPWTIPETTARDSWYGGGSSIPDVWVDGKYEVLGASNCNSAYLQYLNRYNSRMTETGGISPVSVEGYYVATETTGSFHVTCTLLDPVSLGSVRATMFVYEEGMVYNGVTYNEVTRVIKDQVVTGLVNQGDSVTLDIPYTPGNGWNLDHLHGVAILQQTTSPKTIIQAAYLDFVTDFNVALDARVASVPQGNGTALLEATIKNRGLTADVMTIGVDQGTGWTTDMQIAGDTSWYTSIEVPLNPEETVDVVVRVQTNAEHRIGTGNLITESANSGRSQNDSYRVFNGSHSIFLVSDDQNAPYETPFINGLNALNYLYDQWDIYLGHAGAEPAYMDMAGFDAVIWQHGYVTNDISQDGLDALMAYMDAGGSFYYPAMDFLSTQSGPNTFTTDYLGLDSWVNNTQATVAQGVGGDPITDGMSLPLTFEGGSYNNKVDTTNPAPGSSVIFYSETANPAAVRHELPSGGRVVFSSILQNSYSQSDPAPNNSQTVLQRVLEWICPLNPAGVDDSTPVASTRILWAGPNPARDHSQLSFGISPKAATSPVVLTLLDPAGRVVRTLINGRVAAGEHRVSWDGRDESGRLVSSGVYFAQLSSLEGKSTGKLVLMR